VVLAACVLLAVPVPWNAVCAAVQSWPVQMVLRAVQTVMGVEKGRLWDEWMKLHGVCLLFVQMEKASLFGVLTVCVCVSVIARACCVDVVVDKTGTSREQRGWERRGMVTKWGEGGGGGGSHVSSV
jgi:hypothetical protein